MQYREDRYGNPVSVLGYGCMRFTQKAGRPDMKKTEEEIMAAYRAGVNYYDTAYIYPGSEAALGEILEKNGIRDQVRIATKLPHYMVRKAGDLDKYFNEQLKRLRTDYVDYYLMHMLTDTETWKRLCDLGIQEWIQRKKEEKAIRQVGFSYHGNTDMFCKLIDAYDWEFCQIQYNYLDEHSQAGRTGLHYAASRGIPVIIMEPLRGGRLVRNLPHKATALFQDYDRRHSASPGEAASADGGHSPAAWALRWLWDQPEVTCVLSGMNSMDMIQENVRIADTARAGAFGEEERRLLEAVVETLREDMKAGCTGCRYCMPCPKNVDIPGTFAAWNRMAVDGKFTALKEYFMCTVMRKDATSASNCVECGKCEQHCPQNIPIREELKKARKDLEGPAYKIGSGIRRLLMRY